MKYFILIVIAMCLYNGIHAQLSGKTEYAREKELVDQRGKVIGRMTTIPGLRTEIVLRSCLRSKDSTGHNFIEYSFVGQNNSEAHNVTLILQFEKPFDDVIFTTEGEADNVHTTIADNKLGTSYQTSRLAANAVIKIRIMAKNKTLLLLQEFPVRLKPGD